MATLIEEINIRIEVCGGRRKLISELEKEWKPKRFICNPIRADHWLKEDEDFLREEIKRLASTLGRTNLSLGLRLYKICYEKLTNQ